jgi:hypothetical protein
LPQSGDDLYEGHTLKMMKEKQRETLDEKDKWLRNLITVQISSQCENGRKLQEVGLMIRQTLNG